MRALTISLALALAGCSNILGIDHFTNAADANESPDAPETTDDAAVDASTIDGPLIDGPMIDASAIDASPVDARPPDARPPDASPPDAMVDAKLAICGDGVVDPGEQCDDNGNVSGDGCTATCLVENGYQCTGMPSDCEPLCGDGLVIAPEVCDDHNASACGTCNTTCSAGVAVSLATGAINWNGGGAPNSLDGTTITLDDGINPPIAFEWDNNGNVMPGHVSIPFTTNQGGSQTASSLTSAINGQGNNLIITATSSPPNVTLAEDRPTSLGNHPITVSTGTTFFQVSGMQGGSAGDCPTNTGCASNNDCASGTCSSATHKCQ